MREAQGFWGEAGLAMHGLISERRYAIAAAVILVAVPAAGVAIPLAFPGSGDQR